MVKNNYKYTILKHSSKSVIKISVIKMAKAGHN